MANNERPQRGKRGVRARERRKVNGRDRGGGGGRRDRERARGAQHARADRLFEIVGHVALGKEAVERAEVVFALGVDGVHLSDHARGRADEPREQPDADERVEQHVGLARDPQPTAANGRASASTFTRVTAARTAAHGPAAAR